MPSTLINSNIRSFNNHNYVAWAEMSSVEGYSFGPGFLIREVI